MHDLHKDSLAHTQLEPVSGLRYRLRPAQQAQPGQDKAPCLVLLHGVGGNETDLAEVARQFDPRLTVVLARGPLELGPGQYAWFRVAFTAAGPAIDAAQAESSRVTLLDFIGQLPKLHEIDPARIWLAGFSQGGIMSASVGLTAPARLAGFGILSGRILPEVLPLVKPDGALAQLPAFVSHGVDDGTLGIAFARKARTVLEGYGLPLSYHEYAGGHRLSRPMLLDFRGWLDEQLGPVEN